MSEGNALAWATRVLCVLGLLVFGVTGNWPAICWVIVALLQHERAEALATRRRLR